MHADPDQQEIPAKDLGIPRDTIRSSRDEFLRFQAEGAPQPKPGHCAKGNDKSQNDDNQSCDLLLERCGPNQEPGPGPLRWIVQVGVTHQPDENKQLQQGRHPGELSMKVVVPTDDHSKYKISYP